MTLEQLAEWSRYELAEVKRIVKSYDPEDHVKAVICRLAQDKVDIEEQGVDAVRRDLLKLKLERQKGEMLPMEQVHRAWAYIILRFRDKMLRVANKLASRIAYLKDETAIETEVDTEIRDCLTELSRPVEYEDGQENAA